MLQVSKPAVKTLALIGLMLAASTAMAGTGADTTFDDVWLTMTDWMQGTLGRILIGLMVLGGIAAGVLRQSLLSFITGVGGGIGLYAAPDIIESILSATLPTAVATAQALMAVPVGI